MPPPQRGGGRSGSAAHIDHRAGLVPFDTFDIRLSHFCGRDAWLQVHHAFSAEFDGNRPVTLLGTVTMVEWVNPHAWIHMDVTGEDGTVVSWMVEAGAPNAMFRRGFRKDSLPVGTEIVIEGYQAKSGKNMANGRNITLADGRTLFMGSSGTGAPRDGRDPTVR